MGNLTIATTFIVLLNLLMWFGTLAMAEMNPSGTVCYNPTGSVIGNSIDGNPETGVLDNDVVDDLPSAEGTVSTGSTNIFTDIFNNVLGWFKSAPGIKYVYGVIAAPYNILKCMNLPNEFAIGIGALWYLVSLLVFVAFLWGRD